MKLFSYEAHVRISKSVGEGKNTMSLWLITALNTVNIPMEAGQNDLFATSTKIVSGYISTPYSSLRQH
jgi:hypothetical protein